MPAGAIDEREAVGGPVALDLAGAQFSPRQGDGIVAGAPILGGRALAHETAIDLRRLSDDAGAVGSR